MKLAKNKFNVLKGNDALSGSQYGRKWPCSVFCAHCIRERGARPRGLEMWAEPEKSSLRRWFTGSQEQQVCRTGWQGRVAAMGFRLKAAGGWAPSTRCFPLRPSTDWTWPACITRGYLHDSKSSGLDVNYIYNIPDSNIETGDEHCTRWKWGHKVSHCTRVTPFNPHDSPVKQCHPCAGAGELKKTIRMNKLSEITQLVGPAGP